MTPPTCALGSTALRRGLLLAVTLGATAAMAWRSHPERPGELDLWLAGATPVEYLGYGLIALALGAVLLLAASPIDEALARARPLRSDAFKPGSGFVRIEGTLEAREEQPAPISGRPCVYWEMTLMGGRNDLSTEGVSTKFGRHHVDILAEPRWWADGLGIRDVDGLVLLDLEAPRIFMPDSTQKFEVLPNHLEVLRRHVSPEVAAKIYYLREQVLTAGATVVAAGNASRIGGAPSLGGHDLVISGAPHATARRGWLPWVVAGLAAAGLVCIGVGVAMRSSPADANPRLPPGQLRSFPR